MSLTTNVTNLATRVASECKSIRTLMNGNAADLSALTTSAKGNLVAAVNELNAAIAAAAAGSGAISDNTTSTSTTWSSKKTSDQIIAMKDSILGGAGGAYDTLQELKDLLDAQGGTDTSAIAAINTALGNRLRIDVNNQGLTALQQQNGRTNLDVYGTADIGDVTTNFVTTFEAGLT